MTPTGHRPKNRPERRPGPRADEDRAAPAVTLADDALTFHHPAVHEGARMEAGFQRTLRVPDDGRTYPLPAGLGRFPVRHVEDYADRLPEAIRRRGGVLVPMHRAEALWISFRGGAWLGGRSGSWPMAVQVATGKICAVSGAPWRDELARSPRQNYVTVPEQPWLDGYAVEKGTVRQFVAVPLGEGATAEEQLTGRAEWGGIQMQAFPLRREQWERERGEWLREVSRVYASELCSVGLAPGGRIQQEIYEDQRPLSHWDQLSPARVFIHLVSAEDWPRITGEAPPPTPITRETYEKHGIPWFDHYRSELSAVDGGGPLAGLESTGELKVTEDPPGTEGKGAPGPVLPTGPSRRPRTVRSGKF